MSISFTTSHAELLAPLEAIRVLHSNRPIVSALGLVRLGVSSDDEVTISAFDFETCVVGEVSVDDNDGLPGDVLLNRLVLTHIVKAFAIGSTKAQLAKLPLTVREDGGYVTVSGGGYTFTMPFDKDANGDYPQLPPRSVGTFFEAPRDSLVELVTRLQVCAGHDESLPMLTGINVDTVPGGLEFAATDRFRLGVGFLPLESQPLDPVKALLPAKQLSHVVRHMPAGTLTVGLGDQGRIAWVFGKRLSVSMRPLDNEFVKYRSLIPKASDTHHDVLAPRAALLTALKRSQVMVDRGHHSRLRFADGTVTVTAGGHDEGRMESPALPTTQDGKDLEAIAFNPAYLAPALASFSTDQVALRYSTAARPLVLAEPGQLDNEQAFRTLIMPARLPG